MAEVGAVISSTRTRTSRLAVDQDVSKCVESPAPTSGGAPVPPTTNCASEDSQMSRIEPAKDDTELDPVASESVEPRAPTSGGTFVATTTNSASEDSQLSCGEPKEDEPDMSFPLVVLGKRGGEPTTIAGG